MIIKLLTCFVVILVLVAGPVNGQVSKSKTVVRSKSANNLKKMATEDYDHVFNNVSQTAGPAGSAVEWFNYAQDNFDFTAVASHLPDTVQTFHDSVFIKLIVDKNGQKSNFEIVRGNELIGPAAISLIQNSPAWKPASACGRNVFSYRVFKVEIMIDRPKAKFTVVRDVRSYYDTDG